MTGSVTVAMRAHNDLAYLGDTLNALRRQGRRFQLLGLDNASTDGSTELLLGSADLLLHVPAGAYVPGRVLNQAMRETQSEFVVFLNADCEPLNEFWLEELLAPFKNLSVGTTFSKQLPRQGCKALAARDTEATYGHGSHQASWRHCFSMASCAVRRSVWEQIRFDETLAYSEDIAWSWNVKQGGWSIQYVPQSCVYHSHNYTSQQWRTRQQGEGRAEAAIFTWSAWERSFFRYSLLPFVRQVLSDLRYCVMNRRWDGLLDIPGYRLAQMIGRREGFIAGMADKKMSDQKLTIVESL